MRHQSGSIEVITGSMFSGKTDELIRRLRRAKIAKQGVLVVKPSLDTRFSVDKVASHAGSEFEATPIQSPTEIDNLLTEEVTVLAVDEAQFFDGSICGVVQTLADQGRRVIVAGLDTDFRLAATSASISTCVCAPPNPKYNRLFAIVCEGTAWKL